VKNELFRLQTAVGRDGRLVLVAGYARAGKTRLLTEGMQRVTTRRGCDGVPTRSAHGEQSISRLLSGPTGGSRAEFRQQPHRFGHRAERRPARTPAPPGSIRLTSPSASAGGSVVADGAAAIWGRMPADARNAAPDWRKSVPLIVVGSGRSVC
jgi:hypothetical protein